MSKVQDFLIPSKNIYSQQIKEAVIVEVGSGPEFIDNKLSPIKLIYKIVSTDFSTSHPSFEPLTAKDKLSARTAGLLLSDKTIKNWHLNNIVASIWISRNFTFDEVVATYLDDNYFGHDTSSIQQASELYFGKQLSELTIDESLSLIATLHSPLRENLYCRRDSLEIKFFRLSGRLISNWPEKYAEYTFELPEVELPEKLECK